MKIARANFRKVSNYSGNEMIKGRATFGKMTSFNPYTPANETNEGKYKYFAFIAFADVKGKIQKICASVPNYVYEDIDFSQGDSVNIVGRVGRDWDREEIIIYTIVGLANNHPDKSDKKQEDNLKEEKPPSDKETIETMKDMVNTFINTPPTASAEERRSLMDKVDLLKILRNNRGFVGETTRVLSEFYFNLDNFSSHPLRDKAYKLIDHRNSLYKKIDVVQELSAEEEQELISISNKNLPFIFTVFFCVENFNDKKIKNEFRPNLKLIYTVAVEEHQKTAENMNKNPLIEHLSDEQEEFLIEILAKRFNI